jgi:hypothetical protein
MRKPGHPKRNNIKKKIHSKHHKEKGMARRAEATPGHPNKSVTRKQTPDDTDNAAREEENSGKKQERRRNNSGTSRTDSG